MEYVEFIQRVCAHTESIYICIDPRNISFFPSAAGAGVWESSISIEPKDQLFLSTCNPTPLYICRTYPALFSPQPDWVRGSGYNVGGNNSRILDDRVHVLSCCPELLKDLNQVL
jgi:hypothetical protein